MSRSPGPRVAGLCVAGLCVAGLCGLVVALASVPAAGAADAHTGPASEAVDLIALTVGVNGLEVESFDLADGVDAESIGELLEIWDPTIVATSPQGEWEPIRPEDSIGLLGTGSIGASGAGSPASADPLLGEQLAQLALVNASPVWDRAVPGVVVAVLDTGVFDGHEDLSGIVLPGWNAVTDSAASGFYDFHGTFVSSMITAGHDNGLGISATVPNLSILPVQVCTNSCYWSDVVEGIIWATDNGADVINMSLAGPSTSPVMDAALQYARDHGVVVVAAAGNSFHEGDPIMYPSASPLAISVAAVDFDAEHTYFSSSGAHLDLAAPGDLVLAAGVNTAGTYGRASGTSFAAPMVSALAALLKGIDPDLTPEQIEELMENTAQDLGEPGVDPLYGAGLVDFAAAVAAADGSDVSAPTSLAVGRSASGFDVVWEPVAEAVSYEVFVDGALVSGVASSSTAVADPNPVAVAQVGVRSVSVTGARSAITTMLVDPAEPSLEELGARKLEGRFCDGRPVSIVADASGQWRGSEGADVILITSPGVTVVSLGGDDLVCGSAFADTIFTGDGDDRVLAGSGNDLVRGGAGDDQLIGGRGRDRLFGNAGRDRVVGQAGNDRLVGHAGSDRILGGGGRDRLVGGGGDDVLRGGGGNDRLLGGAGTNRLIGGPGRDFLG